MSNYWISGASVQLKKAAYLMADFLPRSGTSCAATAKSNVRR